VGTAARVRGQFLAAMGSRPAGLGPKALMKIKCPFGALGRTLLGRARGLPWETPAIPPRVGKLPTDASSARVADV
jgi:hypothetical protein